MNQREEPTGDEEPGSGKLWITWGRRDGFGASHAIDIAEGTHETGRYFDLQVVDVGAALDDLAERKAERKGAESKAVRKATIDKRKDQIRETLAGRDTGVTGVTLAGLTNICRTTLLPTIRAMLDAGELIDVPAEYVNHGKLCWNSGIALPETASKITKLATKRGWKATQKGTGVTGVAGVGSALVTPVYAEGEPPVCRSPLKGDTDTPVVDTPPEAIETETETRHPLLNGGSV